MFGGNATNQPCRRSNKTLFTSGIEGSTLGTQGSAFNETEARGTCAITLLSVVPDPMCE
jgi:hypothetical protein